MKAVNITIIPQTQFSPMMSFKCFPKIIRFLGNVIPTTQLASLSVLFLSLRKNVLLGKQQEKTGQSKLNIELK